MGTYRQEMDKLKLSEQKKKQLMELYVTEAKEEHNMKKFIKPVAAVAACAAVLLGSVVSGNLAKREQAGSGARTSDRDFSLIVNAAELTEETPVVDYSPGEGDSWALCENEDEGISYSIGAEFACEGDNIASITYHINQGAFQIYAPEDQTPGLTYTETEPMNVPGTGWEEGYTVHYANAYTTDYANQHSENIVIDICGNKQIEKSGDLFGDDLEGQKAAMEELLGDVVITCTVNFTDGTNGSREIILTPAVMTGQEGEPAVCFVYELR